MCDEVARKNQVMELLKKALNLKRAVSLGRKLQRHQVREEA